MRHKKVITDRYDKYASLLCLVFSWWSCKYDLQRAGAMRAAYILSRHVALPSGGSRIFERGEFRFSRITVIASINCYIMPGRSTLSL